MKVADIIEYGCLQNASWSEAGGEEASGMEENLVYWKCVSRREDGWLLTRCRFGAVSGLAPCRVWRRVGFGAVCV